MQTFLGVVGIGTYKIDIEFHIQAIGERIIFAVAKSSTIMIRLFDILYLAILVGYTVGCIKHRASFLVPKINKPT